MSHGGSPQTTEDHEKRGESEAVRKERKRDREGGRQQEGEGGKQRKGKGRRRERKE